jgi:hypothetical protein
VRYNDRVGFWKHYFAPLTAAYLQSPWVSPYDANGDLKRLVLFKRCRYWNIDTNESKTSRTYGNIFGSSTFKDWSTKLILVSIDSLEQERSLEINSPTGYGTTILFFKTNM